MVFCFKSLQLQGRLPQTDFIWPLQLSSLPGALLSSWCLGVRVRVCVAPTDMFCKQLWWGGPQETSSSLACSQTAACSFAFTCQLPLGFIRYFCCPISSLTSPVTGSLWVPVLALLWQSVRGGDPCVFPVFSSHNQWQRWPSGSQC